MSNGLSFDSRGILTNFALYRKYDFRVISMNDRDLEKLDDLLPTQLLKLFPNGFRFQ